jgi:predicted GNAT superfamily acetyltransferase
MARGVDLVEWTFDPLELKNAYFNLERLGAIMRRYVPNQYGITASPLHGGLPTDRLVAEWWLRTGWVEITLSGERPRPPVERRIEVTADIERLRREAPKQAREIQKAAGESFMDCFERGLAVIGFERAGTYLLGRWESE